MKLHTNISTLTPAQIRRVVSCTINWCKENMGENHRRANTFSYSVKKQSPAEVKTINAQAMGVFNPSKNKLIIFHNNNDDIRDLVQTTIHEYTHYLQPISKYYKFFDKLYGYYNNPFEVAAFGNEKKYYKKAWRSISPLLY